ncbi:MAG: precorrin-6y C5,15-methyltransferase (decarboxylating) subunit CbiE [Alphaproteobacteria bacterium]
MTAKWLSVVGIGEAGLESLTAEARAALDAAEVLVGGARHLSMVPDDGRERLEWPTPISDAFPGIEARRGTRFCVLATGDPLNYGVGAMLLRHFSIEEMTIHPGVSAFSLAAARLGWSLPDSDCITVHGRPAEQVQAAIAPGRRLLILCGRGEDPVAVAAMLRGRGFADSAMIAFEHMGGPKERRIDGTAADWPAGPIADFVTLAVDCVAGPDAAAYSRAAGLPDDAFVNDGQLTKREVRAATLAMLAPLPGELLWDVGAGCGSVAIEWLRAHRSCHAVAIERDEKRIGYIRQNAGALGVPQLEIVEGDAPDALADLPAPDAVFVGGGVSADGMLDTCWSALKSGGRLVANVISVEGEHALYHWHAAHGGELRRIAVQNATSAGRFMSWRPKMPVTQYVGVKP